MLDTSSVSRARCAPRSMLRERHGVEPIRCLGSGQALCYDGRMYRHLGQTQTQIQRPPAASILVHPLALTLRVLGTGLAAYHGYKRTGKVGSAVGWGILGTLFPVITNSVAVAQGYGKRA